MEQDVIHDAVVVGAGIAGLNAAHRLINEGADVAVVADTVGGRTVYDKDQKVNFGTYFVMTNYHNAKKFLTETQWINPLSCRFFDEDGASYATLSKNTLKRSPGFIAFIAAMTTFIRHYEQFKKHCEFMSQRDAMALDPYIKRLYDQPASAWIAEHHVGGFARDYITKFSYACTGVDAEAINALDFCNVTHGLVLQMHLFTFDADAQERALGSHFIRDLVVSHEEQDGIHVVTTEGGREIRARNVVFAAPAYDTARLLGLDTSKVRATSALYVENIRGTMRPGLDVEEMNLFPFTSPIIFTARQPVGTYLVYSREPDIDKDKLFSEWELIGRKEWEKAEYVVGNAYIEQQYGPSTFVAGDHNGLGLEPAAISGLYAANQVLKTLPSRVDPRATFVPPASSFTPQES
jgi:hypothetical protein